METKSFMWRYPHYTRKIECILTIKVRKFKTKLSTYTDSITSLLVCFPQNTPHCFVKSSHVIICLKIMRERVKGGREKERERASSNHFTGLISVRPQ